MIRNPAQIMQMRLGRPVKPANFGGDSDSDSSVHTTNNTTNWTDYYDKRAVAQDSAVSLTGDGNNIDRSTTNLTSFIDTSNRSTNFSDSSNRSTAFNSNNTSIFTDNSDRSVQMTTTDHGSVNASVGLAGAMSGKALDVASLGIMGAIDTLKLQSELGLKATQQVFDMAKASGANALQSSAAVIGMANNAIEKSNAAFQEADDGGEKKMVMYALVAVTVIGVAMAWRN